MSARGVYIQVLLEVHTLTPWLQGIQVSKPMSGFVTP